MGQPLRGEANGLVLDCVERQSRLRIRDLRGDGGELAGANLEHLSRREREGPAPQAWEGEGLRGFRRKRRHDSLILRGP